MTTTVFFKKDQKYTSNKPNFLNFYVFTESLNKTNFASLLSSNLTLSENMKNVKTALFYFISLLKSCFLLEDRNRKSIEITIPNYLS